MRGSVTYYVTLGMGGEGGGPGESEFLRAEDGDNEVDEGGEGDQADEEVFHGGGGKLGRMGRAQRIFSQKEA
jgi:hypothetical protein